MKRPLTFAILGDSAASGVGDYDESGRPRGWCYHLAQSFHDPIHIISVARPGAQSREVIEVQLPKVLPYAPDIAALIVGGNDALRNGFSPIDLYQNLRTSIIEMKKSGTEILMFQLHDPTEIVPLPRLLQRVLRRRIDAVNEVYERLCKEFEVVFLNTRSLEGIYSPELWHFDRMHPSSFGHQTIAHHFRELLAVRGWKFNQMRPALSRSTARKDKMLWMLRNATPWFLKRSVDLLPAALVLMIYEAVRLSFQKVHNLLYPSGLSK